MQSNIVNVENLKNCMGMEITVSKIVISGSK